ncbi:F-type H+-transporting ATPase subunit b [Paucidesulfovibrio gracilis DSM 16080]|uniref:ATP synthase subunit b n=1 Tax=Paucidesulfovibrio gracilis DSM 16080 TaxID=1121449 RepID=A0A1T4XKE7_9BACT|nr:ATP synthase F0 subunit B [Paucidesulfovibrio gracilis]SKA89585.1 F-type H+-transporting ATPase subunit b [Paucidesulfovibrio gracilis DSM 16080]
MVIPDNSIYIQFINFLLLVVLLNWALIKPIRGIIQKRKELMAEQMGGIEQFTSDADTKLKDYEAALDAARKEGVEVRTRLKEEGTSKEQELMSAAGQQAATTLREAEAQIESEVKSAMDALKKDVDGYAQKATNKILGQA